MRRDFRPTVLGSVLAFGFASVIDAWLKPGAWRSKSKERTYLMRRGFRPTVRGAQTLALPECIAP
jgi:hypothetical protein